VNASSVHAPSRANSVSGLIDSWETVASAIIELRASNEEVVLAITGDNFFQILYDFDKNRAFTKADIKRLPPAPVNLQLMLEPIESVDSPEAPLQWQAPEPLLWQIGSNAFEDGVAPWLGAGEAYTLSKWLDVTSVSATPQELQVISILVSNLLSIEQLAKAANVSVEVSAETISKLSLLDHLRVAPALSEATLAKLAEATAAREAQKKAEAAAPAPVKVAPPVRPAAPKAPTTPAQKAPLSRLLPTRRPQASTPKPVEVPVAAPIASQPTPPTAQAPTAPRPAPKSTPETPKLVRPISVFEAAKASLDKINGALPEVDLEVYTPPEPLEELSEEEAPEAEPVEVIEEPEIPEEPAGPVIAPQLYPVFNLEAPPAPVYVKEPAVRGPRIGIETSFESILMSDAPTEEGDSKESDSDKKRRLFGKLRPKRD
jgi:hypothetical protein